MVLPTRALGRRIDGYNGTHTVGHSKTVPGLWPPTHKAGRTSTGKRRAAPPQEHTVGAKAPTAK